MALSNVVAVLQSTPCKGQMLYPWAYNDSFRFTKPVERARSNHERSNT